MPFNNAKSQRGFTLIEMSIVLVIIGLIVGGILKGQEIIESARQKNMASMHDQLKAAQNTFLDRYRALPGDFLFATTRLNANVADGNGNGFVATAAPAANEAALVAINGAAGEEMNYFNGLIAADLFAGGQVTPGGTAVTSFSGGVARSPLPAGPWTQSGLTIAEGTHVGDTAANNAITTQWLRLQIFGTSVTAALAPLTTKSAYQLDQKFDDGLPTSGRLRTSGLTANPCGSAATNVYAVTAAANTNGRQCDMYFSMQ